MTTVTTLKAEKRDASGKGAARALRREGKTPAIIYGGKGEEISIATEQKELVVQYMKGGFSSKIVDIEIGKEKVRVIPRDVQLHPVTDVPLHADFMRVSDDSKVNVFVKVRFLNPEKSPGLKRGGVLNVIRRDIELLCRADSIPTKLEVDLSGFKIGQSVHAHHITFPNGVEPIIQDRDFTIAAIVGRGIKEDSDEEEATAEASEEGAAEAASEE